MKKEITQEKKCTNCRYYIQHYLKGDTGYYAGYWGHCINDANRRKRKPREICELWEDMAIREIKRKKTIKKL